MYLCACKFIKMFNDYFKYFYNYNVNTKLKRKSNLKISTIFNTVEANYLCMIIQVGIIYHKSNTYIPNTTNKLQF